MNEPLYPRHASAPADRLAEDLRCSHCGRVDPRCGTVIEMVKTSGMIRVVTCAALS